MITIQLSPEDLLNTRFAYSAMLELTLSRRIILAKHSKHGMARWVEQARQAMNHIELPYFDALVSQGGYVPDFITPTPEQPETDIEAAFEAMRNTDPAVVQSTLERAYFCPKSSEGDQPEIIEHYYSFPHEAIECLIQEMRYYWQRVIEPQWSQIRAILDGDVLFRARQMALAGREDMIDGLHPAIQYERDTGQIAINKKYTDHNMHVDIGGRGLQVVPAVFSGSSFHWQIFPEYTPMLIYSPRGAGNLYATAPDPSPALEVLLGGGRASVLESLLIPLSTSELATRLHMTAGAVSQHLARLKEAGLVEPQRSGRWVYYHLTERGTQFINLFAS